MHLTRAELEAKLAEARTAIEGLENAQRILAHEFMRFDDGRKRELAAAESREKALLNRLTAIVRAAHGESITFKGDLWQQLLLASGELRDAARAAGEETP